MASADSAGVRATQDWDYLRRNHFRRRVATLALGSRPVDLDELRKVHAIPKRGADRGAIGSKAVRGDLEPLARSRQPQTFDKGIGAALVTAADGHIEPQLGA